MKRVTLVLDPQFGEQAETQVGLGPLWVIKSPRNAAVIERLWTSQLSDLACAPTIFDAVPDRSAEDSAAAFIGTVHDHHPDWEVFEVVGARLSPRLLATLHECAAGSAEETPRGFVFTRDQPSS